MTFYSVYPGCLMQCKKAGKKGKGGGGEPKLLLFLEMTYVKNPKDL